MNKRFTISFRKSSGLPSGPIWDSNHWADCNPGPTDAFPEIEKENLSVYLYSPHLGGNAIELKLESYGEDPTAKYFSSAAIPWDNANGNRELLDRSGLADYQPDPTHPLPLTVQYFLQAREVVAGGDSFAHEGSGPNWNQIDVNTMTREWVWVLTAQWTYDNRSEILMLVPSDRWQGLDPELFYGPGSRTLFGDYYVISNHWEAMYWEDGMGYVDGYYDGLTNERASFIISESEHLNG